MQVVGIKIIPPETDLDHADTSTNLFNISYKTLSKAIVTWNEDIQTQPKCHHTFTAEINIFCPSVDMH